MVIDRYNVFRDREIAKFAWRRLTKFQNVELLTNKLIELHKLPEKHHRNARRHAAEIKYCLAQAKEYFDAASPVSAATRPVLLYYGAMSLALAEILLKQGGDSRLQKLRQFHNHHGLSLVVSGPIDRNTSFVDAASSLISRPAIHKERGPYGTFEVWRQSSREYPAGGIITHVHKGLQTSSYGYGLALMASDTSPERLDPAGVNLLDCLKLIPEMMPFLGDHGVVANLVRSTFTAQFQEDPPLRIADLVIHPCLKPVLDEFRALAVFKPSAPEHLTLTEFPLGCGYRFPMGDTAKIHVELPWCTTKDTESLFFVTRKQPLNEFGLIYVSLHICGNFARYYPDHWLAHIETSSPLALSIEHLMEIACERLPLLALSELERSLFVQAA